MTPAVDRCGAIVFTDIVGFTALTELHGDDAALQLVDAHDEAVRTVMPTRARVVKELGDGMLLWFDRPTEALAAALALQSQLGRTTASGLPLWVRVGAHVGTPRHRGTDLIGRDVNLASRIASVGAPGEVVCSQSFFESVATECAPGIEFTSLGAVFVKGVAEPVQLYRAAPSC